MNTRPAAGRSSKQRRKPRASQGRTSSRNAAFEHLERRDLLSSLPAGTAEEIRDPWGRLFSPYGPPDAGASGHSPVRHELVVIDAGVPDYQRLLGAAASESRQGSRQVETMLIERDADGLVAISQALAQYRDLDAVHIVSHASPGKLQLGRTELSDATLQTSSGLVRAWGESLAADADILLYGCDLAANATGRQFVRELSLLTGADVAGSVDRTGSARRNANWDLEYTTGKIEAASAISPTTQATWDGQLLIAQVYFVPLPEDQIKAAMTKLYASTGSTIDSTVSIVPAQNNALVYYDHWEDGYEANIESPAQTTTQVWGDGNPANGMPPGFATDVLTPDDVIVLRNNITVPRTASPILFDGRDKIATTRAVAVTRAAWPTTPGSVLSGAVEVVAVNNWDTEYVSPVGQNAPNAAFNEMFQYTSLLVMAAADSTGIQIDTDGNGSVDITTTLNQGQSYQIDGGVMVGARVTATSPVQVQLITGDVGTTYESDWFTLYPREAWSNNYYNPVGTTVADDPAATFLYNPNAAAITVNYATLAGTGTISVPAATDPATHGIVRFQMPTNSGARFYTTGSPAPEFFALGAVDTDTSGSGNNVHDWGFTLVPDTYLTPALKVGWAPGAGDQPISGNGSPVWVMAEAAVRVYVDYDGSPLTGPLTDPNGNKYDVAYDVNALQSLRLYDPDKDQTGMRVYTVNGTRITGAWGQDPATAAPGNPYLDVGYTVLPLPVFYVRKDGTIVGGDGDSYVDPGETIQYSIVVRNDGVVPLSGIRITDPLPANTTYVTGSSSIENYDGTGNTPIPDDPSGTPYPLDAPGYVISTLQVREAKRIKFRVSAANPIPGGVTEILNTVTADDGSQPLAVENRLPVQPPTPATCGTVQFTTAGYAPVGSYQENATIYLQVTDSDANANSGVAETITVLLNNTSTTDRETITLTETGLSTGIFRGSIPSSTATGQAVDNGTLYALAGNSLIATYTDATCPGGGSTATASVTVPTAGKPLYLDTDGTDSDTAGDLDRIDPVNVTPQDTTTSQTALLGVGGTGIAVAATTNGSTTNGTSLTFAHTPGSGANRLLLVAVGVGETTVGGGTPGTVTGVTYGGTAMTLVGSASPPAGTGTRSYVYRLVNPAAGPANVVVSMSLASSIAAGATTFTGVSQSTPLGTATTNSADTGDSGSVVVSSATGELVFSTAAWDEGSGNQSITVAAGQTSRWELDGLNYVSAAASTKPGAASVTSTYTSGNSQEWAAVAVPIKPAPPGVPSASYNQTPTMSSNLVLPAGASVTASAYIEMGVGTPTAGDGVINVTATLSGGSPAFPSLGAPTATLQAGTGPNGGAVYLLQWTGTLASQTTVSAGTAVGLTIGTTDGDFNFRVLYDSATYPSKIVLPTTTVIDVAALGVYDAPYTNNGIGTDDGNVIVSATSGQTVYVRALVTDPFGAADITSLTMNISPAPGAVTPTRVIPLGSTGQALYEYAWYTSSSQGTFDVTVRANEGYEGNVFDMAGTQFTVSFQDVGTPSTTEFTNGNNGPGTLTYPSGGTVWVRVTDVDQNTNAGVAETVTAVITTSTGDTQTITLTETGPNTGIFTTTLGYPGSAVTNVPNDGIIHDPSSTVLYVTYIDPNDPADTSSDIAMVPAAIPQMAVTKTLVQPASGVAAVGDILSYRIVVSNTGNVNLTGVTVADDYASPYMSYSSSTPLPSNPGGDPLNWAVGTLNVSQSVTIDVLLTATAACTLVQSTNTATGDSNETTPVTDTAQVLIAGRISGQVRDDIDVDGNVGDAESGIANVTVTLYNDVNDDGRYTAGIDTLAASTTTDASGNYSFSGLAAGNYVIVQTDLLGYTSTNDADPPNDNLICLTLAAGQSSTGNDFLDTTAVLPDLSLDKQISNPTPRVGDTVTFTLVISNVPGATTATNVSVTDALPSGYSYVPGSIAGGDVRTDANPTAPGLQWTISSLAGGASVNLTYQVTVLPTGLYDNYAEIMSANQVDADSTPGNGPQSPDEDDDDTLTPSVVPVCDLQITKTDGVATYTPGLGITYTILVTNAGPSFVTGAAVADTIPASITGAAWTAVFAGVGSSGTASGSGNINETISLAVGGTATYTVTGTVLATATGNLVNTVTVAAPVGTTDPTPGNNSATDTDTCAPRADLQVTKTDGCATYTPGLGITYTILVTNAGPSFVTGAAVADTIPASITGAAWTAVFAGVGSSGTASGSGNINQTINLAVGGTATYTVTGTVLATATGNLVNTVTVAAPVGTTDPTPGNNSATDTDTCAPRADLQVTKTDGSATYTPGLGITYTIVVTNAGPSFVTGAAVADTIPASITGAAWTAVFAGVGSSGTASGSGTINQTISLAVGGTATYTVTGTVLATATGNLVNTVTVAAPVGTTDPTPGNNSATDTDTCAPRADLQVTKTDGSATYTPGLGITYTIVVTNAGPSFVTGAAVADTIPASITGAAWTAVFAGVGSSGTASGSGNINETISLAVGGTATYTVTGTVLATATGNLVNTVTVAAPVGTTDPTPGNNSATDTDTCAPRADLQVTKTDGSATYTPGLGITYTIVVTNAGPSFVTGAAVADTIPASITGAAWTAVFAGVGSSGTASGSGNINQTINLAVGGTATYTVTGTVLATATGNLVNTVTVAAPVGTTDPTPGNNSASDTDTCAPRADLQVTKTDGSATYTPGLGITYTIVVTNAGPSFVTGAAVADTIPASITGAAWTAVFAGVGSSGNASGSGNINQTINLAVGGTATYTVTGTVLATATGNLVNTVTVAAPVGTTDPTPGNNSATDTDTWGPGADLQVTKTDGSATYTPGVGLTYTIVVSNAGPSNVVGAAVGDTFDAALGTPTWTATGTAGTVFTASGSGNLAETVSMPVGGSITYTVTVAQVNPARTGNLVNTATVSVPAGVTDPTPGNNSATDTDTPDLRSDLSITKTDGSATYTPGGGLTYTIVVSNAGPSNVVGATVGDTFDAALGTPTWTATGTAGTVFTASGSSNLAETVSMPVGGSITYTVTVAQVNPARTGNLVNTASVSVPAGVTDPTPGNNSATDTDTPDLRSDLSITKTDGSATYTPGVGLTYTIVVSNAGSSNVVGATVGDTFDAALGTPTWTATGTAGTVFAASGSGHLAETVSMPVGGSITYTVTVAQVNPARTGNLVNTATVSVPAGVTDPTPGNNSATDTDTPDLRSDLSITKTDGSATYTPGVGLTYTIVVSNAGPSNVVGATVGDTFDAALGTPTWTATGTAGTVFTASGSSNLAETVSMPVGGSITYTVTVAQVNPARTGNLVNTASVSVPAGVTDPTPGNNSATDTDTPDLRSDLSITKTDGSATYTPGVGLTYTIVVSNAGSSNVVGATVGDTFDAALGAPTWSATGTAGTAFTASGSGHLAETVSIPVGGSITYMVTVAQVNPARTGNLVNTATVSAPAGVTDPTPGNNSATDTDTPDLRSDLSITKTDGSATYTPGVGLTYTIVVSNAGPSNVVGATVGDTFDAALGTPTWTATGTAGTVFAASGSGHLAETVSMPVGGSITYTVTVAQVNPARTGNLVNTATVSVPAGVADPTPGNNSATDTDTPDLRSDLSITKTDGSATYTPGLGLTYTIVVSNAGPSNVVGATVGDTFDAALGTPTWTATGTAGTVFTASGSSNLAETVSMPVGGSITYTVTVAQVNPARTGNLVNTATVSVPAGVTDPTPGNNSATDTDTPDLRSDLSITKTDGSATYTPGLGLTYTIVVSNAGPSNVVGATVGDTFDAALGTPTWTATGTAGAVFTASGSSNLAETVSMPVGGSITYTVTVAQVNPARTGNLVNTATVSVPAGVTDPTPGNNSATDTDTPDLRSDLSITKTDGSATYTPGLGLTYTIVVSNAGPSNVVGATVGDTFDAALGTPTWTATGTAGTVFTASGSSNLAETVSMPVGGSITYTVTVAQVNPARTGNLVNTATVSAPAGVTDPTPGNNSATDTDTPDLRSDLSITKTDGSATYTPGLGLTYTIVVSNAGPSNVVGATVGDTFDAALGTPTWTATGTAGAVFTASGSSNLAETISMPVGGSITYTVTVAQVNPARTGNLVNTATVSAPAGVTDPTPGNNSATDTDTPDLRSDLSITKTDGSATYTPGVGLTYTIVVSNAGPSNVVGATVGDTFDAALGTPTWTATGTAGAVFTASGSSNLAETISMPVGGSITYTVTVAQVNPARTGNLVNTATVSAPAGVTDPTPGNNSATDTDTPDLRSDLSITKTDGSATYTPGVGLTYTIVVSNAGPSNVVGATVGDTFDAALGTPTWTATGTAGTVFAASGSGHLAETVSMPVGGSITYTVTVAQVNPARTGNLVNTATVSVPAGVTDPTPGNNSATDTDTPDLRSDLSITKTDGSATYTPGVGLTYTIVVSNAGPSNVVGATVGDTFDAALGTPTWTATGTAGTVFAASGSGHLAETVSMPVGGSITYTVTVAQVNPARTGNLVNTATVSAPAGVTDPTPGNNSATDTDTPDLRSDLSITKTDGSATYTPGLGLTYTIVVSNAGPSNVVGATVGDTFDAALGTPTWTATGTAGAVFTASGSSNLAETVSMPVGGSITYTVTVAQVNPARTGNLVNTATVSVPAGVTDPTPGNNSATDTDTPDLRSDLSITKTDGSATYTPGVGLTYTIVVSNAGPSNVVGATVGDTFDAALGTPTWTATGTAGTVFTASGSGNLAETVSMPVGGSITYTVTVAQVNPARTGNLVNTATVSVPAGVTDPTPGNNSATDTDTPDLRSDLSITKTDGSATYTPGVGLTYTIVVSNAGPSNVVGATVGDTFDAALGTPTWTATGTAGTVFTASGSSNLAETVSMPVGGSITYTVTVAQVNPARTGNLVNTATVSVPAGVTDPTPGNNSATDTDTPDLRSDLSITKTDGSATYTPGVGLTYTIVVSNAGPSNVVGATVGDTFDAALGTPTWTATGTAGTVFAASGSGHLAETVSMPVGGSITYTVTVAQVNPARTGNLVNTATVSTAAGVTDPTPGNNSATDTDTPDLRSDLSITKTDGSATYTPGVGLTYTIVVSNAGPSNVVGATVGDTFDAALGTPTWTATGTAGTAFTASGSGHLAETVSMPVGGSITYTVTVAQVNPARTGNLVNTATVSVPAGVTDSTPGNNSATDTDTPDLRSDLSITKTDGSATYTPGVGLTYTIVVSNAGPSNVVGATVGDTFDAALGTPTWTATGTAGTVFTTSGSGSLAETVSMPVGGSITYTVTVAQVNPARTGNLVNTATVSAPAGVTDPTPGNNSATDTDTPDLRSDLSITKTDGSATYTPGVGLTYTIVVSNAGPSNVVGATVGDTFDAALGTPTWTATGTAGTVFTASGSGHLAETVSMPVGGSITYTVTVAQVNPARTGNLVNTATVSVPAGVTDPTPGNNSATDTDTPDLRSDLSITKTDGSATYTPGLGLTYTIVVSNAGPSNVVGATVGDTFDAALGTPTWTATGTAGAVFTASGSSNLAETISMPVGGSITYTVTVAQVNPARTGNLVNTATVSAAAGVTDPTPGNNSATDTDTPDLRSDLSITKTDGSATYTPGVGLTYTIVVSNAGPSNVVGATVGDTFDAALGTPTWTATGTAGAVFAASGSGHLAETVSMPVGGSITYTVTVAQVNPARTGNLVNTATVSVPAGVTDPTPGNNSATDTDTPDLRSDLSITKTDGSATYTPGVGLTYTIVVSNAGPSNVVGATVGDTFDAALGTPTWTATGTAGTVFAASGSGHLAETVSMPVGGSITYTVTVAQVNPARTGNLVNTATVSAPAGVTDPTPGNNSATDTDTPDLRSDLSITKTDGSATYTPGLGLTYTIVVSNAGPSNVVGATVGDTFDAALGTPTWTATGTAGAVFTASGSSNLAETVSMPVGGSITYTVTVAQVNPARTGNLVNTATVSAPAGVTDPTPGNNSATDTDTPDLRSDLSITKTDGALTTVPGTSISYTIVVTNAGPSAVTGAAVTDTLPAAITGVTYTAIATGGATGFTASGSGNIGDTVNLPVGSTITYTVTGTINPAALGSLTNTATVAVPPSVTDPTPGNNTASDTDTLTPRADLSITKTDNQTTAVPGTAITYTIVVSNAGPSAVSGATVSDSLPGAITGATFTATATGGATGFTASGSGNLNDVVSMPAGSTITYTVAGTINPATLGSLTNRASVSLPPIVSDPTPGNNTATDTDTLTPRADLSITKTNNQTRAVPGTSITYAVVVTNLGPSAVMGATVTDTLPATITGVTYTASAAGGATGFTASGSGNIGDTVNLPVGSTITYTVTGTINPAALGSLTNTATVAVPPSVTDPTPGNNTASDTDTLTPQADLSITKTNNQTTAVPGTAITYTIVVANAGPSSVTGATVSDSLPTAISGVTYTASATGGATGFTASGSGNISDAVNMPVGSTITYTVCGTINPAALGTLTNTATVSAPPEVTDPTTNNSSSSDTDTLIPSADLEITKTDGTSTIAAGDGVTRAYTITVTNHGPSTAQNVSVQDTWPDVLVRGAIVPSQGTTANGADGNDFTWSVGTLAAGTSAVLTVSYTVPSNAPAGPVVNVGTATSSTPDPDTNNGAVSDTNLIRQVTVVLGQDKQPQGPPSVRLVNTANGQVLREFLAYEPSYVGGVRVAVGDLTGDGVDEIVVAPGRSRAPEIRVFTKDGVELPEYRTMAFDTSYQGGVYVAVGDVDGDGMNDLVVSQGYDQGLVRVFLNQKAKQATYVPGSDYLADTAYREFYPFSPSLIGGSVVAAADVGQRTALGTFANLPDGRAEIIVGSAGGMRATLRVFDASLLSPAAVATVFPFNNGPLPYEGGLSLNLARINSDAIPDVVVGAGAGGGSAVEAWVWDNSLANAQLSRLGAFAPFGDHASLQAPVRAAGVDSDGDGIADSIVAVQGPDGTSQQVRVFSSTATSSSWTVVPASVHGSFPGGWFVAATPPSVPVASPGASISGVGASTVGTPLELTASALGSGLDWLDVTTADVNGDGRADLVGRTNTGAWWVAKTNATGTGSVNEYWGYWSPIAWQDVHAADVNGDGRADLVGRTDAGQWWVARSNGTQFISELWGTWSTGTWHDVQVADMNGDGRDDLVGRTDAGQWWVAKSTGTQFSSELWGAWAPIAWLDVQVADLNGDGRADLVGRTAQGSWWAAKTNASGSGLINEFWGYWSPVAWLDVAVQDVTGDGRADIVGRTDSGQWWVARTNASGSGSGNEYWGYWSPIFWHDVQVRDVTGDGQADIVGRTDGGQWWVARSTGSAFNSSHWASWSPGVVWSDVQLADRNGPDGSPSAHRADVVGRASNGQWWAGNSTGTGFATEYWGIWSSGLSYAWSVVRDGVPYVTGTGQQFTFTPSATGTYLVTMTVADAFGVGDTVSNTITVGTPLLAAVAPALTQAVQPLTADQLATVVDQAVAVWQAAGLDAEHIARLRQVRVSAADLSGSLLGLATQDTILLDLDAAGFGWNTEARSPGNADSPMDLLSAVMHEFGHVLGLDDQHDPLLNSDVMFDTLQPGTRRLPTSDDVDALFGHSKWS